MNRLELTVFTADQEATVKGALMAPGSVPMLQLRVRDRKAPLGVNLTELTLFLDPEPGDPRTAIDVLHRIERAAHRVAAEIEQREGEAYATRHAGDGP